jgi:hypothetical protein
VRERVAVWCFSKRLARETFVVDAELVKFLKSLDYQRVVGFEHFDKATSMHD